MSNTDKKYNLTIAGLYPIKSGFWSLKVDSRTFDAIQGVKLGGKFVIKVRDKSKRTKDTEPYAYLEYMTPDQVQEFESRRRAPTTNDSI